MIVLTDIPNKTVSCIKLDPPVNILIEGTNTRVDIDLIEVSSDYIDGQKPYHAFGFYKSLGVVPFNEKIRTSLSNNNLTNKELADLLYYAQDDDKSFELVQKLKALLGDGFKIELELKEITDCGFRWPHQQNRKLILK